MGRVSSTIAKDPSSTGNHICAHIFSIGRQLQGSSSHHLQVTAMSSSAPCLKRRVFTLSKVANLIPSSHWALSLLHSADHTHQSFPGDHSSSRPSR